MCLEESGGDVDQVLDSKSLNNKLLFFTEGDGDAVAEEEDEEDDDLDDLDDEDTVDMRAYQVLGGCVHFDLLTLPPQPKQVKSWLMTQGLFCALTKFNIADPMLWFTIMICEGLYLHCE